MTIVTRQAAGAIALVNVHGDVAGRLFHVFVLKIYRLSTLQEIKTAIGNLNPRDKALLAAELFAMNTEPDEKELERSLERGLADVEAGRVRSIEEVKSMIPRWTSKS